MNQNKADQLAKIEIFHRSRDKKDVVGAENFTKADLPAGLLGKLKAFVGAPQGGKIPPSSCITSSSSSTPRGTIRSYSLDRPTCRTMRSTTTHENLLQIKGSKELAACYLAEFLRLYEQYRARADWLARKKAKEKGKDETFKLTKDAAWAKKHFRKNSPEAHARENMA